MEEFKIRHFLNELPGRTFPEYETLSESEAENFRSRLRDQLGMADDAEPLAVVIRLRDVGQYLKENAETEGFDLRVVLAGTGIKPAQDVYVNWYRFDNIDRIGFEDLADHFDSIWYPGPDDIDVFDATLSWVLSIDHEGYVQIALLMARQLSIHDEFVPAPLIVSPTQSSP